MENIVDESILKKLGLKPDQFVNKQAILRTLYLGVSRAYNDSFRNVISLNLLNLVTDEMDYQNNNKGLENLSINDSEQMDMASKSNTSHNQHKLNRDSYGRANYYFTITSPDYIKQLFEQDYEDTEEGRNELSSQIKTITSFINTVEKHLAQGFLDRSSMKTVQDRRTHYEHHKNPIKNEMEEHPHVHGLFKEYFNSSFEENPLFEYLQCPNLKSFSSPTWEEVFKLKDHKEVTLDDLEEIYKSVFESNRYSISGHLDSCKNIDLQVLFREIFSTKELSKEQEFTKCRLAEVLSNFGFMSKEQATAIEKNYMEIFQNGAFEESDFYKLICSSQAYPWVLPVDERKKLFVEEFKHKNDIDTVTFIQNYTLLSSLAKEGGLTYKNNATGEDDNESVNGNSNFDIACTNEVDFKRAQEEILKDDKYTIMEVNIARSPKLIFKEYIENSKKKFLGQYFEDNKISKELFWENPELQLDFEKLSTALITERNMFYSVAWANFMEGLINHYMEEEIIPAVETDVCQKMFQPALRMLYYIKKYDCLQEGKKIELKDRKIPEPLKKMLKEFDDLYVTSNGEEQDKRLQKFVDQAEQYIEVYYIPALVMMMIESMKNYNFLAIKVIEGLGPLFYYIDPELETTEASLEESEASEEDVEQIFAPDAVLPEISADFSTLFSKGIPSALTDKVTEDLLKQSSFGEDHLQKTSEAFAKYIQDAREDDNKQVDYDSSDLTSFGNDTINEKDPFTIMFKEKLSNLVEETAAILKNEQDRMKTEVREKLAKERKDKIKKEDHDIDTGFHTFRRIFSLGIENKWI